jgi:hypothetical protein
LALYKKAIRNYNASKIKYIKTTLPKSFIYAYYKHYENKTKNKQAYKQLNIIANKLHIKGPLLTRKPIVAKVPTKTINTTKKGEPVLNQEIEQALENKETSSKNTSSWYNFTPKVTKEEVLKEEVLKEEVVKEVVKEEVIKKIQKKPKKVPYSYYLNNASLNELRAYLSKPSNKKSLSKSNYALLKQRENIMKEQRLLKEGSLEELISAYKHNKKPVFKARILSRMKEELK